MSKKGQWLARKDSNLPSPDPESVQSTPAHWRCGSRWSTLLGALAPLATNLGALEREPGVMRLRPAEPLPGGQLAQRGRLRARPWRHQTFDDFRVDQRATVRGRSDGRDQRVP